MSEIKQAFKELPGWTFHIDEISAGVYRVRGGDEAGRSVERSGTDPDVLLAECREAAVKMRDKVPERR